MRIKNVSLVFIVLSFLLLFTLGGYCLFGVDKNIETYDNPDIDYNAYRYFTFFTGKLSTDYLQNKTFQSSIIELLEGKNYIYVKDLKDADFVMILYCSNLYAKSSVDVSFYRPAKKIEDPHDNHQILFIPGSWNERTTTRKMYYPFVGISCIGNLQSEPVLIWQGQGMELTSRSNLLRYGQDLIEEVLSNFPEISEKPEGELPPVEIEVEEDRGEKIRMLLEELKDD